ncbi:MFS transporter [Solimicrobium silvestre]|uniref:MFS transporter n=1 Tax=Solimicrobium silvestre TaxID=2099400 RepID=UPI000CFBC497|nr:MFS transporter [Solimicrobium silvestre]
MKPKNQFVLLLQRRFAPFFWTQFLGALNDNVFKTALLTILTFDALNWTTMDVGVLNNLIPGLFILPFLLFSASAGQIADKVEKGKLARAVKLLEIFIMSVAALGWFSHQLWLLIVAVAGMGLHSTLFGPVKYAYLPQHLKNDELVGGNGIIEMGTFVGILLGEIIGAVLVVHKPWGIHLVALGTIGIAILGCAVSWKIPRSPAPAPNLVMNWNPFTETVRNIRFSSRNRTVFLSLLGNSWFWFYGAIVLAQFPQYAKEYLHGDHSVFVLLLAVFSVGIGAGSLLCERLSGHKVEIGLVPFGAIGLSLFGIDLYLSSVQYVNTSSVDLFQFVQQTGSWRILFDIVCIGIFGGLYIVPLFALIQTRCDPEHMSRTIAGMNILNSLFMVVAALSAMVMLKSGLSIPQIFLVTACLNGLVAIYIFSLVPEFLMRFLVWLLIHTIHRVRGIDISRIPETGAAVLVCNHVSYLDALVIAACAPRPIRFVMDHRIFNIPVFSWIFKTGKAIPIASAKEDPWIMEHAFVDIAKALHDGDLVCIFPEGRLTQNGELNTFKNGIQKIIERTPVPVIPMALRGLWGSIYSRGSDNPFKRTFRRGLFSKLELIVGEPIPSELATPEFLQEKVQALRGQWQ